MAYQIYKKPVPYGTLTLKPGQFAYNAPEVNENKLMTSAYAEYMYPYKTLSGVPIWERGQFVSGGGIYAPGGPGGGVTFGPTYRQPGAFMPGQCNQVQGGVLRCVSAPYGEKGLETGRGWPPEIGPSEMSMMDQGCRPTGRQCGGTPRAPSQYWCCPGGSMAIGIPSAFGSTGENTEPWYKKHAPWLIAGAFVAGYLIGR
jgi:hypothetical protein